jgi:hypothetical protein
MLQDAEALELLGWGLDGYDVKIYAQPTWASNVEFRGM